MQEQRDPKGIEWTRILRSDGTGIKGFTWNVITGCQHGCVWKMPDGSTAGCYAKTFTERGVARSLYPDGFEVHQFHPDRLSQPLRRKRPAGIFLDSMSDLVAHYVPEDEVRQVLDVCLRAHWHTFFVLTKNAPRLLHFPFSPNVWVGASLPPDYMFGHAMSRIQQVKMLNRTMATLAQVETPVRWVSFEPLSWDCADIVAQYPGVLQWAVIGAASDGAREYPPDAAVLHRLLDVLDAQVVPVFYKGNLRSLPETRANWRAAFPPVGHGTE